MTSTSDTKRIALAAADKIDPVLVRAIATYSTSTNPELQSAAARMETRRQTIASLVEAAILEGIDNAIQSVVDDSPSLDPSTFPAQ